MTIGQLATQWGVSRDRVMSLVDCGELDGAFIIPSSGRYGKTLKIPYQAVLEAEARWAINGNGNTKKCKRAPRKHNGSRPKLKHFPELNDPPEPPAETHEA